MQELENVKRIHALSLIKDELENLGLVTEELVKNISNAIIYGVDETNWDFISDFSSNYQFIDRQFHLSDDQNRRIYFYGVWKTLFELLKRSNSHNQEINDFSSLINQSKHIDKLITLIYHIKGSTHHDLALHLALSPSGLTNVIKRIDKLDLLSTVRLGKRKIYRLSSKGIKLYKYLENRRNRLDYQTKQSALLIMETLTAISQELSQNVQQPANVVKHISKYAPLTREEQKLIIIKTEEIFYKSERVNINEAIRKLKMARATRPYENQIARKNYTEHIYYEYDIESSIYNRSVIEINEIDKMNARVYCHTE